MSIIEKAVLASRSRQKARTDKGRHRPPAEAERRSVDHRLEARTRIPFRAPLENKGILVNRNADPGIYDQIRHIKRPVLQRAFGRLAQPAARMLAVTSPGAGAGKSFTSVNLAMALSFEKDYRVVLIDGDVAKATITKDLGLADRPGLFDVLADDSLRLSDVILDCTDAELTIIPAGRPAVDSVELLSSHRAKSLLAEWAPADGNTLLVVDCPPLLSSPDALAIVGLAGQILVITAAGQTGQDSLNRALGMLDEDKPVGLVLNKVPSTILLSEEREGYGYGYGYGPED